MRTYGSRSRVAGAGAVTHATTGASISLAGRANGLVRGDVDDFCSDSVSNRHGLAVGSRLTNAGAEVRKVGDGDVVLVDVPNCVVVGASKGTEDVDDGVGVDEVGRVRLVEANRRH